MEGGGLHALSGDKSDANIRDIPHILQLAASLLRPPRWGQEGLRGLRWPWV